MLKKTLVTAALALALTNTAEAHGRGGGHHHHGGHGPGFGLYFGAPFIYPRSFYTPYYDPFYYPYYSPRPIVQIPAEPPVYIERERPIQQPQQQLQEGYWYYCASPEGYYPYVNQCPGGWRQVDPIPPQ